jgi:Transposase DDE domain group 1
MSQDTTIQRVLFPGLLDKVVVAQFDQQQGSSDGGAVLLQAADRQLGLSAALARWLRDHRQSGKVEHTIQQMLQQRIFGLACGYADTNDAARLSDDPVHKLLVGLNPAGEERLASQPTLCRFENAFGGKQLFRCGEALAETVLSRQRRRLKKRVRKITLDVDATDDPTHGEQQLSFFNGHYHHSCYLPLLCFATFNDEREQFLLTAVLQPGNAAPAGVGLGVLRRVIERVRGYFPEASLRVRLDSAYATPEMLDHLDEAGVEYVVSLIANSALDRQAEAKMQVVRKLSAASGQSERLYGECRYRTLKTWKKPRRVIYKAEVVREGERAPRDNQHYLVTNFQQTPGWIYEKFYCQRGDIENRIKELHHGLEMDRTSCHGFWANQLRVLLTAAAYVLMQELRIRATGTECSRCQVQQLRERLLKIGASLVVSVRRVVLHLPRTFPLLSSFRHIALGLGAEAG